MIKEEFSKIQNRKELSQFFESIFKKTYINLKNRQRLEHEDTLPKSYIVEFNTGDKNINKSSEKDKRKILIETLGEIKEEVGFEIRETDDPSLTYLHTSAADFFIDSFDPRFLFFHTLAKSNDGNRFIFGKLIKAGHHFDCAWLTVQFLEKLANKSAYVEGWDARFNPIEDLEEVQKPTYLKQRVNVSIDEPNSWQRYENNKEVRFFNELPLDTLRIRSVTEDGFIARARIQSDGKMTGRGTSYQEYLNIAIGVKDDYKKTVLGLENKYSIRFIKDNHGLRISGEPFTIRFSKEIEKFDDFIDAMFSCTLPFKLFGTPQKIKENYYVINAIDLHIASKISFEISPTFMRIYLPDNTCGNSIVRIIRSLQHKVDPNLTFE